MRKIAMLVGAVALAPASGLAQPVVQGVAPTDRTLSDVAFVSGPPTSLARAPVRLRSDAAAASTGEVLATPNLLDQSLVAPSGARISATGQGLMGWRFSEATRPVGGGAVDTVRMGVASVSRTPFGGPSASDPTAVDLNVTRGWPAAVTLEAGDVGVNVSPHAGFGFSSLGGSSAEAGATVKLGSLKSILQDKLDALGVKDGSSFYGDQGRFYLFAAVRGQAVGLNMQASGGALRRTGWSTDISSALVGDGQVGMGWRKGGIEAAVGYVHRSVHLRNAPLGVSDSYADDMAAFSFTFHPRW